ncbi:MAG TPA: tetratricopeptide repeat protein [Candidatus Acidoferrum sp.]|nr:tetratricopeptide repeat protein [Candidatus Acidoferrum sp.]
MAAEPQLDALGPSSKGRVILFLIAAFLLGSPALAQETSSDEARLAAAERAFDAGRSDDATRLARGPANQSAELDFLEGLALARLEKWTEAKLAFEAGAKKAPHDPRFFVELGGIAYKRKDFRTAKRYLHAALRWHPDDPYSQEFLATIYFLEGNLPAALKYWNPEGKPRIRSVAFAPPLELKESLGDRSLAFNAPQILAGDALLTTQARLANLGIFSNERIELRSADSGNYDVTLDLTERNGWGDSNWEGLVSLFCGLPYRTIYPEFYNLGRAAVNLTSLARWDSEKRRVSLAFSMPIHGDPGRRFGLYADARNENWNLAETFFGPGIPLLDLNMRRVFVGAEFHAVVDGRSSWSGGVEIANRNFRNLVGHISPAERPFFTDAASLSGWLGVQRALRRVPERRFAMDSSAEGRVAREFADGLGRFGALRGSLSAHWFPQAQGDDYEMQAQVRAGGIAGKTTLDELFQLGVERDNDLWLRGHAGTAGGRKGAAPLGRRYFLANWELDKNIYRNGFFTVKLGPFLDSGAVADSSELFGSRRWLWDSGVQAKVRILGSLTVVFSYGRDLRGGKGVFYGTVLR